MVQLIGLLIYDDYCSHGNILCRGENSSEKAAVVAKTSVEIS